MKKRDKLRYDREFGAESELSAAMAGEESAEFFHDQAAALLAAEFFAGQEDDVVDLVVASEELSLEPAAAVESDDLLAAGEILAVQGDVEQSVVDCSDEVAGSGDGYSSVGEIGSVDGELSQNDVGGEVWQEPNQPSVQSRGYGLEDMSGDEVLPASDEASDKQGDEAVDLSAGSFDGVGSASVDYNAIADRVYDMLLRQIRAELAGSGAVTE